MEPSWWETALSNLWDIVGTCITKLTNNEYLAILLVAALVIVAFKVFKKAKSAAKK